MTFFARHGRFLAALAVGLAAAAAMAGLTVSPALRMLVAADLVFATYLILFGLQVAAATPDDIRRHAADRDEGLPLILAIAALSVAVSLAGTVLLLRDGGAGGLEAALALAAVPTGWATVHALLALHYAHTFYAPDPDGGDARGLEFPGGGEPGVWDFLYFSFNIAMTAQVSDVTVHTTPLRRAVLLHSAGSFFYNAVILALAVNAGLNLAG